MSITNQHGPIELPIAGQPNERIDAAANRERILAAARCVLAEHGADGMSMNAVAAAAGVGKGTIFRRFGDRGGLTEALLGEHAIELQDAFLSGPPPLGPGASAAARLEAFVDALVRFQVEHMELVLAAERLVITAPPIYATFLIHASTLVAEIDPTVDAQVMAGLILSSIAPPVIRRLRETFGADADAISAAAIALLRGLTGPASL